MANELKIKKLRSVAKYRQVEIADLKTGRRGKHHELVQGNCAGIDNAAAGFSP